MSEFVWSHLCWSALECVGVRCSALECAGVSQSMMKCDGVCCSVCKRDGVCCGVFGFRVVYYGVATISRLLEITGLFCKRAL